MAAAGEDVYATLLLNDSYLPGALVLAHSIRDAGTAKKLAVLVTTDTVSVDAMVELQKLFDFIIPVERIDNSTPANLYLMDRVDLQSTFTKITLWKQTQFRRIVYMDADVVALRAPDELFNLPQPFSAAPDIGWPDIFNTGVMVLNPNMGDYYALLAMAQRGISFDGADQGLLNMHFKNSYNRLSFTYNVTPSPHYQYLPAYRHFQSSISMAHFIGSNKPWNAGRDANLGSSPYDEMVGRWWAVYDRHYRDSPFEPSSAAAVAQQHTTEEYHQPAAIEEPLVESSDVINEVEMANVPPAQTQLDQKIYHSTWDASRAPPPSSSEPEAKNFPSTHYDMSSDPTPFKSPKKYPEPPKNMYYEVPKTPTYQKPAPIFPWEKNASKPTRVFADDDADVFEDSSNDSLEATEVASAPVEAEKPSMVTLALPTFHLTPADPWQSFTRGNAWDDIPEIEKYIGNLQKNRKGNIQVLQGYGAGIQPLSSPGAAIQSMRLTDFPTELERPSLPVTPAPIRRPSFWGNERDEDGELPAAEGVPSQVDWDPAAQLEQLARRQSEVLASKLGLEGGAGREIPTRPLPYGSEGVVSPTYVAPTPRPTTINNPSYMGPGAAWEKGEDIPTTEPSLLPSEEEKDVLEN